MQSSGFLWFCLFAGFSLRFFLCVNKYVFLYRSGGRVTVYRERKCSSAVVRILIGSHVVEVIVWRLHEIAMGAKF